MSRTVEARHLFGRIIMKNRMQSILLLFVLALQTIYYLAFVGGDEWMIIKQKHLINKCEFSLPRNQRCTIIATPLDQSSLE